MIHSTSLMIWMPVPDEAFLVENTGQFFVQIDKVSTLEPIPSTGVWALHPRPSVSPSTLAMHRARKVNQWHLGMEVHIVVDEDSGLARQVHWAAANVADVTQVQALLHGKEDTVSGDAALADRGEKLDRKWWDRHVRMNLIRVAHVAEPVDVPEVVSVGKRPDNRASR